MTDKLCTFFTWWFENSFAAALNRKTVVGRIAMVALTPALVVVFSIVFIALGVILALGVGIGEVFDYVKGDDEK